ncbi:MAG: phosphatidylserine decarboxylase [Bdellovibrionales bacterium]|nr:phosphatidylserine decarboxylase [Bdellovibrionales bacterium]
MIRLFDRSKDAWTEEQVFGDAWIRRAYGDGLLAKVVLNPSVQKIVSRTLGWYYEGSRSRKGVAPFVQHYGVNLDEFVVPAGGFKSFNDFFVRHFKLGARRFPVDDQVLGAPAEGRLSVFPISAADFVLNVKGVPQSLARLVGSPVLAQEYLGGHAFVFRLCPVDYHRFHFPDAGRAGPATRLGDQLHSVNPAAQARVPDVFLRNERQLTLFESRNFGSMILMEVGAIGVGKIIQTYQAGARVDRGQEKGTFAFGGSTTIMLTQRDCVVPDADLLQRTADGFESLVRLGEPIARAVVKSG